jgi:hypothetical protein
MMGGTIGKKRYQIMKQNASIPFDCCTVEGKEFDDSQLAASFMRSAPFTTYLLDRKTNEIVAENIVA